MKTAQYLPVAGSWEENVRTAHLDSDACCDMYSSALAGAQLLGTILVAAAAQVMPMIAGVQCNSPARSPRVAT